MPTFIVDARSFCEVTNAADWTVIRQWCRQWERI